jgi:hypothetical protein
MFRARSIAFTRTMQAISFRITGTQAASETAPPPIAKTEAGDADRQTTPCQTKVIAGRRHVQFQLPGVIEDLRPAV